MYLILWCNKVVYLLMSATGATTLSIMTFSIKIISIETFSNTTLSITTLSIMTFSIKILKHKNIQHYDTQQILYIILGWRSLLEKLAKDKHTSLLQKFVNNE